MVNNCTSLHIKQNSRALLWGKPWQHAGFSSQCHTLRLIWGSKLHSTQNYQAIPDSDANPVLLLYPIWLNCYNCCSHNIPLSWNNSMNSNAAILLSAWIFWWTMRTGYSIVSDSNMHVYLEKLKCVTFLLFTPGMISLG